ncbi:protein PF14_0175-like isoform X2 [Apis florea]|nr:protein PF14_0175-like isoform X2 [Apis florea]XP_031776355.1 protein PF14_0175-like isoform X2 [Apis florea]
MPENAQTESVVPMMFDNFVLKRWLRSIGPVRRSEVLKKLKTDLENLGLSRKQVHQGLMQLATKPHVVLTRQSLYRKCGLKNLENERENKIVDNCRMIDVQKLNNIEWIVEGRNKHIKKTNSVKVYEDSLIKNNREFFIHGCKVEIPLTAFHSFDKALEQFDKLVSSKMNMHEKLSNRRASVIVSTDSIIKSQNNTFSSKKYNKNENHLTYIEDKNSRIQKISNLISDKIDRVSATKKIDIKLNLKSSSDKKENNCVKSESYKVLNTYYIKSHINKKLCNDKKIMDVKLNNTSSKNNYSKKETIDYKIEENAKKRTVYEPVTSDFTQRKKIRTSIDEHKEINRKKRKKLKKFRAYFGDCITISEDEQEQIILQNRFERKRKKDSADSSDSGVYITDKSMPLQIIKDIQKTISNSIICGKFNENLSGETIVNANIDYESKVINNEDIKTIDSIENKKVSKIKQDIYGKIIANVNTNNESKEIIDKEIDNKSTKTIDSVLKIKQDVSESIHLAIANVNINNELKEVSGNETIDSIESLINMEIENNELQIIQTKKNNISQEKLINTDKDNVILNKHRLSVIQSKDRSNKDIPQITKEIEGSASLKKVEIKTGNTTLSSDIFCSTNDTINVTEDFSELQNYNLDIKDFNDLLYMDITETCQITSNGNVLSIQETIEEVINKNIDENSNLKNLSETQIDCNQDIKKTKSNCIEENNKDLNKMQSSDTMIETNTNDRIISINNMNNVSKKENELPVAEFKLNILEKKNIQSNNLSQSRLRVLSSAELGSRWCPTPINTVMSSVPQFSHSTPHFTNTATLSNVNLDNTIVVSTSMAQIVPTTISLITTSAPTAINETTISENMRKNNIDHKFSKSVYIIFVNIRDLIQKRRNTNLNINYDKLLFTEFENLRKILNIEDYIDLIDGVLSILNKEMLVMPLLSLGELFHYTPLIESFYICSSNKRKTVVNNSNECQIITPVIVSSQITSNQNRYSNPQVSQNVCVTSMHSTLQHVVPVNQNQTSTNVTLKQSYQNSQGKVILQSQNNSFQNNMPINSTAINNHNIHQHNYNMQMHKIVTQQKVPNSYFVQQKPATNIYTMQNLPVQHSSFSFNINQLGDRQISLSNPQFINQKYVPQNVFTSQKNTFYNVNPSYPIQQNINSTHLQNIVMPPVTQQYQNPTHQQNVYSISQDIQLQTIPQHIPLNYNIRQSVQPIFAMNVSYNELKHRKIPQKISMEALQNHVSEQVSSSQKQHKKTKSISKKKNLQISLESTTKLFNVLKYISDIQKIVLLKQIDFCFSCTTWLQQQFTSEQWQKINSQRCLLLNFRTRLKHLIEKTVKDFLPDKSQGNMFEKNILKNIKIDVPKMVQIVVNENEGMYCQEVTKAYQEQNKIMNVKQNCVTHQENLTQNQYEKEHEATNNSQNKEVSNEKQKLEISNKEVQNKTFGKRILIQKDNSPVKSSLQICETSEIVVHQENKIEEESNNSKDTYNLNIKEQNLGVPGKIIENISQIIEEKTSVLSNMKLPNNDILQLNQHLVTVEISSNNDQVTVIDTNASNETKSKNEESTEELQKKLQKELHISSSSLENTSYNILTISSPKIANNVKDFDNEDLNNSSLEETITSHIEDIRSISLETFEKMEETNNIISTTDGNIEEEEIKICLFCGKPSTVACSICLEAKYCSKECFERHWQDHYKECTPVKKRVYN